MSAMLLTGYIIVVLGGLWLLVVIFQTSVAWGILSILVPFVSLLFVIMHWDDTKRPFLVQLVGLVLIYFGADAALDSAGLG
ncbi:hypothetical protein [Dokdonella immobilis]|uniref:Uncharacterized protein n=1 Tax=Dokdonella immobilis TaxID=578942 RepID=A0A1I4YIU0_9GAMM|nr:hypothetical protein [Dokdonella immobilis]SFN37520.1 hypothetical protein SAMN05216289_11780 [Dokdonella immobilis]